jgi:hypothetical protein
MSEDKPKTIVEYKKWLHERHKEEISDRTENHYQGAASRMLEIFEGADFWTSLKHNLKELDARYQIDQGYPLWASPEAPSLSVKPFDSFLEKTFRQNVLDNENWPEEPKHGWVLPDNWFSKVNDIVRTTLVVKYLDGVEFLVRELQSVCRDCKLFSRPYFEAREEGYYAAHVYVYREFEIPQLTWDTKTVSASVECRITTQLQEVIGRLTHKYYEDRRLRFEKPETKWQWDYSSDEFVANYLGHILHYLEGMIMEIREKQRSGNERRV